MPLSIDGGDKFYADVALDEVSDTEAIELEDATGMSWLEFVQGLTRGSVKSQRALVWLAMHREDPSVKPADVHYEMGKFRTKEDDTPVPLPEASETSGDGTPPRSTPTSESDPSTG